MSSKKSDLESNHTPPNNSKRVPEIPKKLSDYALFIAACVTIAGVVAIAYEFTHAQEEIKNTREAVNNLGKLVNSSNIALSSINKTSTEISHQTILEAVAIEGNHVMKAHTCSASTTYPRINNNYTIFYQEYGVNPEIMTERGVESVVPYYADFRFEVEFSNTTQNRVKDTLQIYPEIPLFLIDPENSNSFTLNITQATSLAKHYDSDKIRILLDYGFAPYSKAVNSNVISYVNNFTGVPLIEYTLIPKEGWVDGHRGGICS